ncbi:MAG: peptidase M3 [Flavobacteriaceae bacterium]|nr:peptidase M3 [Flavobacteriaceae bacterium]|tara:strand:+ start:2886 stop:5009 length:2124 start_codon:yes stop_codon:yes gene_type:complete
MEKIAFSIISFATITLFFISLGCNNNKSSNLNPLLNDWVGPYGGIPSFDLMEERHIMEAMEEGISRHLDEINEIANNPNPATFENTVVEMERSGDLLNRVYAYYGIFGSNRSTPEFQKIEIELAPKLSEYSSKIYQNEELFQRIKIVYESSQKDPLDSEAQRLTMLLYKQFEMGGAELDKEKKARYAEINSELSKLYTTFSNNVLHDEENYNTFIDETQLGGLPDAFINSAAQIASNLGKEGYYAITNTRSSMDPFLTFSNEREIREKVWKNYYSRGDNNDQYDNKKIIAEILKLRRERVNLLGNANYAEWRLQNRMAKKPENAMDLMEAVWPSAVDRVTKEVADMQTLASNDNIVVAPWDYRYYAEKVRKKQYDLDSDQVRQYLQLDKLREAMFYVAGRIFNFKFISVTDNKVPVFHDDVKVWEVVDQETDKFIGLWYLDPFARPGKRSGAWATTYRSYSSFDGQKTVLGSNNSNFIKPPKGEALLISWDDAVTLFHEFGHALHYFSSNVKYPSSNGAVWDSVEFQSQLLERWLYTDEVINQYLIHHETGQAIPESLVEKIKKAATFNQGFATTEYLASALIDMKIHLADPDGLDVEEFEKNTLIELGMPKELVMRHRTPHFGHVFSGEGYATNYYGYMWAEVLTADAAEAFFEAPGGFYDEELADKLVKYLFASQNTMDPAEAYIKFRGRKANIEALMRDRGFIK